MHTEGQKSPRHERRKYDPVLDTDICSSCRHFLDSDHTKAYEKPTLPTLRATAAQNCIRCQLVLGGIEKFKHFWTGDPNSGLDGAMDSWEEDEIKVGMYAYPNDPLEVIVTRPRRHTKGYDWLELEFYSHAGEEKAFPEFVVAGDVPEDSADGACFETIRGWINACEAHHKLCTSARTFDSLPARLVEVGLPGSSPRLRLRSEITDLTRYTALSHSWGKKEERKQPMPKTTTDNLEDRRHGIEWSELTKTFQDAVMITRKLGLDHIWIDSLCIIQDDEEDWATEASRMASIYENAHVVISATRSRIGDDGCFSSRSCSRQVVQTDENRKSFEVYIKQKISHRDFAQSPTTFATMPLFERAWVFQERLLATRVIHYTEHEIMWECQECLRCECLGIESNKDWESRTNTGNFKLDHAQVLQSSDLSVRYKQWSKIVGEYTSRSLSFESDRFPALSGVASQIRLPGMGRYLAGLWENSMPQALLWNTSVGIVEKGFTTRRSRKYRAPTWSWGSLEAECRIWMATPEDELQYACSIIDVDCSRNSSDVFGQVTDGQLRLAGPVVMATLEYRPRKNYPDKLNYSACFNGYEERINEDIPLNDGPDGVPAGSPILLVVIVGSREIPNKIERVTKAYWKNATPSNYWMGLALKPSSRRIACYERIGRITGLVSELGPTEHKEVTIV